VKEAIWTFQNIFSNVDIDVEVIKQMGRYQVERINIKSSTNSLNPLPSVICCFPSKMMPLPGG